MGWLGLVTLALSLLSLGTALYLQRLNLRDEKKTHGKNRKRQSFIVALILIGGFLSAAEKIVGFVEERIERSSAKTEAAIQLSWEQVITRRLTALSVFLQLQEPHAYRELERDLKLLRIEVYMGSWEGTEPGFLTIRYTKRKKDNSSRDDPNRLRVVVTDRGGRVISRVKSQINSLEPASDAVHLLRQSWKRAVAHEQRPAILREMPVDSVYSALPPAEVFITRGPPRLAEMSTMRFRVVLPAGSNLEDYRALRFGISVPSPPLMGAYPLNELSGSIDLLNGWQSRTYADSQGLLWTEIAVGGDEVLNMLQAKFRTERRAQLTVQNETP